MLELSISPEKRLMALLKYSRPIGTDKRKRAFVVTQKVYFLFKIYHKYSWIPKRKLNV